MSTPADRNALARTLGAAWLVLLLAAPGPVAAEESIGQQIENEVARLLLERSNDGAMEVEIPPMGGFAPPDTDPATVEIRVSLGSRERLGRSVPVTVALLSEGKQVKRGVVTAKIRRPRDVVVAARRLPRGHEIGRGDVRIESRDMLTLREAAVTEPDVLVGMRMTRSLSEGAPVPAGSVEPAPVVSRGETVRLRFATGALRIEAFGQAREDAAEGQPVRVRNLDTQREVVGVAVAKGVVDVRR